MKTGSGNVLDSSSSKVDPDYDLDRQKVEPKSSPTTLAPSPRTGRPHFEIEADRGAPPTLARPTAQGAYFPSRNYWWLGLVALLLIIGLGVALYFWLAPKPDPLASFKIEPPITALTVGNNAQLQSNTNLNLAFGVGGTVSQVMVKPGDLVKKDQVLATLNDQQLQNNLKTAQSNLTTAQNELAILKAGAAETQIQLAQQQLNDARLKVDSLKSPKGTATEIDSARAQLASAKAQLEQMRQGGNPADKAKAQAAITTAQAELLSAQTTLDKLQAGPLTADINAATAKVTQAQTDLNNLTTSYFNQIAQAQIDRDKGLRVLYQAEDKYKATYSQLHYTDGRMKDGVSQQELQQESSTYTEFQDALNKFNKLDSALTELRTAQYNALRQAETRLSTAQANLEIAKATPTEADLSKAKVTVAQAQAKLDTAKANLVQITPTEADLARVQSEVSVLEANLARLSTGATPAEIASAENLVQNRELLLQELLQGPNSSDLAIKQAQVDLRQSELDRVTAQLAYSQLKAPMDGMVVGVSMTQGQVVGISTEVVQLLDTSTMSVQLYVSEAIGSKLHLNQLLTVNFQNMPERSFSGKISYISPRTQLTTGPGYGITVSTLEMNS